MQRLLHAFEVVQATDGGHYIGGIGALFAPRLDPATFFAGVQELVEQALGAVVGEQALTKVMQQVERHVEGFPGVEVIDAEVSLHAPDDE